jgi:hypothetical protein
VPEHGIVFVDGLDRKRGVPLEQSLHVLQHRDGAVHGIAQQRQANDVDPEQLRGDIRHVAGVHADPGAALGAQREHLGNARVGGDVGRGVTIESARVHLVGFEVLEQLEHEGRSSGLHKVNEEEPRTFGVGHRARRQNAPSQSICSIGSSIPFASR